MTFTQNPLATRIKQPQCALTAFSNASGNSTGLSIMTAGVNGSKVVAILITSTDTINHAMQLTIGNSAANVIMSGFNVVAAAGNDGLNPTCEVLVGTGMMALPQDDAGQKYFYVPASNSCYLTITSNSVTTGKNMYISCIYGDF